MNGAAAVPDRNTRMPNATSTTMIGNSHHFLLVFRKYRNSDTMPLRCCSPAAVLKSFIVPTLSTGCPCPVRPRGPGVGFQSPAAIARAPRPPTAHSHHPPGHLYEG